MKRLSFVLCGMLLYASIASAAEKGHDLTYALTRVDDPDADVRASVFQVCRMTSPEGLHTIEQFLDANPNIPSADSRHQLQQIVTQQRAARKQLDDKYVAREKWLQHVTLDAYDKVGTKNEKWNDSARDAITLFYTNDRTVDDQNRMANDMRGFAKQECSDPLVFLLYTIWARQMYNVHPDQQVPHYLKAAQKLEASAYPASLKIIGYAAYFDAVYQSYRVPNPPIGPGPAQSVEHFRDATLALIPSAVKDDGMDENDLFGDLQSCMQAEQSVGIDRKRAADLIGDVLKTTFGNDSAQADVWQGDFLIDYAWDARGGGWANTVGADQWKSFAERISAASDALQASWTKDPTALRGMAARQMITICMAQSAPDAMRETWFQHAMEANPNDVDACYTEMNAVDPRWSGDTGGRLVTLARECELCGNDQARIPLIVGPIYLALARSTVNSDGTALNHDYFQKPQIWEQITRIYGPYLQQHPADESARNRYILCAAAADHWDVADAQADLLAGYPDAGIYYGDNADYYKIWRRVADRLKK